MAGEIGQQRGVIVYKRENAFIGRVRGSARALVAGAEIALRDRRVTPEGAVFWPTSPCQGRWVRCGETSTQDCRSGFQRRCGNCQFDCHDPIVKSRTAHVSREPWKGPDPGLAAVSELLRLAEPLAIAGAVANYD